MIEKDLFLSGEAFDLLRFLSQQPEGCAPRADLAARFTDAETYLAALEDRGLIQGADAQPLPQQPGCAVVGVAWRAVQLTPQGRICLRIHDAQREREQHMQAQLEDFRRQLLKTQQQTADALQQSRNDLANYQSQQAEQHARDEQQRILDRKKSSRDQLICAAFSVCLTLLLEHLPDVVGFFDRLLKSAFTFFQGL